MDKKNRIYYVVEQPIPLTYQIVKAINKIPSVKCSFRTRRPYLIVGVAPNRENELVEVVKDMGGFDFSREIETLEKTSITLDDILNDLNFNGRNYRTNSYLNNSVWRKAELRDGFLLRILVDGKIRYFNDSKYYSLNRCFLPYDAFIYDSYKVALAKKEFLENKISHWANLLSTCVEFTTNVDKDNTMKNVFLERARSIYSQTMPEIQREIENNMFEKILLECEMQRVLNGKTYSFDIVPFSYFK